MLAKGVDFFQREPITWVPLGEVPVGVGESSGQSSRELGGSHILQSMSPSLGHIGQ